MARFLLDKKTYNHLLKKIERLVDLDPAPGTLEAEELEIFVEIVESHEKEVYKFDKPTKLSKLIFRLSQKHNMPWMERFL